MIVNFGEEPIADFDLDNVQGCAPVNVDFTNNSLPDSDFMWDFGNGVQDSVNFDPSVSYTSPGIYDVLLYVYDDVCDVFDVDSAEVIVTAEPVIDLIDVDDNTRALLDFFLTTHPKKFLSFFFTCR